MIVREAWVSVSGPSLKLEDLFHSSLIASLPQSLLWLSLALLSICLQVIIEFPKN